MVVKVLRPHAIRDSGALAAAAIGKEVLALQRLSERDPPTPYVVRFFDSGVLRFGDHALELPWFAVEYVDGGSEGTTLSARVERERARSGHAFTRTRALRAVASMAAGVTAIHEVGVIHRDVAPGNVLCSGTGDTERFTIADLGLARVSSAATFGSVLLGTPGYCAPEQSFPDRVGVGPYTDVFGLACTIYFLLTGDPYFVAATIPETLVAVYGDERQSVRDARYTAPELRNDADACRTIDEILALSTRSDPRERPESAAELGDVLCAALEAR